MKRGSIAFRLFWLSAGWLIVALVATAFLLTELYYQALDRSLTETLDFHVATLVGATLEADSPASSDVLVADARFTRPTSGWYWQISDDDGRVINFSPSIVGTALPALDTPFNAANTRTQIIEDGSGQRLRAIERRITLDSVSRVSIVVTGNLAEVDELVVGFRGQAIIVLAVVGIMLAGMSAMIARFALRPIGHLREAVEAVREGEAQSVQGTFPQEISPLAEEVNELLRSNSQIIERARNQVGNLAHGLKTPLAVLRNEADGGTTTLARTVMSETTNMSRIVSTYLDKARLAARTTVVGKRSDTQAVLTRLVRVMSKLNGNRTIEANIDPATPWFRGDDSDLEEIVGNLLDNACKWATQKVRLSAKETLIEGNRQLLIVIEDDGNGLDPEQAAKVLRRGVRLDEKTPGSGLGLDIVMELVDVYGGALNLSRSDLGGLRAELLLPAARSGR